MYNKYTLAALLAALPQAMAAYQGFNYGSVWVDGSAKTQSDFESLFKKAASLDGTDGGFTSARLYTMVQGGTTSDVISAIPAAIATKTSLLLGLWASGETFANELAALKAAIATYGDELTDLIAGISVGSEDLYRNSVTGIENDSGIGANPDTLVKYIKEVRAAISGTAWSGASIGHVDTWTAWVNSTNNEVIDNLDWLGVDAYPYFQNTMDNDVSLGASLLNAALSETESAAQGKPVWITETGWPTTGKQQNQAVASAANAKTYWDDVGCPRFGKVNVWWYTLEDGDPSIPEFGVIGSATATTPLYDLTCSANMTTTSSSSAAASTSTAASSSSTGTAAAGSGTKTTLTTAGTAAASGAGSAKASTSAAAGTGKNTATTAKYTTTGATTGAGSAATSGSGAGSTTGSGSSPTTIVTSGATMMTTSVGAALVAVVAAMFTL